MKYWCQEIGLYIKHEYINRLQVYCQECTPNCNSDCHRKTQKEKKGK